MILAGLLNHFTFCDVITTIMYVTSVDNVKNANSFEDKFLYYLITLARSDN